MEYLVFIGTNSNGKTIINRCSNYGNVKALGANTYMADAGGIIGDGTCTMTITNCYNGGDIYAEKVSYAYVGGIAGRTQTQSSTTPLTLNRCYSMGKVNAENVTANRILGGIGGAVDIPGITNAYYYNQYENMPKALRNNNDYEEQNVIGIDKSFDSFELFIEWLDSTKGETND